MRLVFLDFFFFSGEIAIFERAKSPEKSGSYNGCGTSMSLFVFPKAWCPAVTWVIIILPTRLHLDFQF